MALPISNIPILTGVAAASFVKNAKAVEENRGSIDFSRQCAEWRGFDVRNEDVALFCLGNLQSVECKRFCPCFA